MKLIWHFRYSDAGATGINFMEITGNKLKYILTTAYAEYALEGYEYNVVDYLLKPVSFDRLYKSALKAQERLSNNETSAGQYFCKIFRPAAPH